jgi:hypothetical protein
VKKLHDTPILQRVFDLFQTRLNFLWRDENAPSTEEFSDRLAKEASLRQIEPQSAGIIYVEQIEAKATALLQHISMMIALTGIYFVFSNGSFVFTLLLTLEIVGYIWAALCCLRCLLQIATLQWKDFDAEGLRSAYELEAFKRELIYRHAMQVLVLLTIALAVIVVLHSFLHII